MYIVPGIINETIFKECGYMKIYDSVYGFKDFWIWCTHWKLWLSKFKNLHLIMAFLRHDVFIDFSKFLDGFISGLALEETDDNLTKMEVGQELNKLERNIQ